MLNSSVFVLLGVVLLVVLISSLIYIGSSFAIPFLKASGRALWFRLDQALDSKFFQRHTRSLTFLRNRFDTSRVSGLHLTVGSLVAVSALLLFFELVENVFFENTFREIDRFISNLFLDVRSSILTDFFSFVTNLAGVGGVILITVSALVFLFVRSKPRIALFFGSAVLIQQAITITLKYAFARERPAESLRLVVEESYSFPSGHTMAATVVFGLIGYILITSGALKNAYNAIIFIATTSLVLLVGMSRIYLGVHYPSDVLGSILIGSFLLTVFILYRELSSPVKK